MCIALWPAHPLSAQQSISWGLMTHHGTGGSATNYVKKQAENRYTAKCFNLSAKRAWSCRSGTSLCWWKDSGVSLGQPGLVAGASCRQPAGGGDARPGTAPLSPAASPGDDVQQCLGTSWHHACAMRPWKGVWGRKVHGSPAGCSFLALRAPSPRSHRSGPQLCFPTSLGGSPSTRQHCKGGEGWEGRRMLSQCLTQA